MVTRIAVNKTIGENNMSEVLEDIKQFLERNQLDPDVTAEYDADEGNRDGKKVTLVRTRFVIDADLTQKQYRGQDGLQKLIRGKLIGMGFTTHDLFFNVSDNLSVKSKSR